MNTLKLGYLGLSILMLIVIFILGSKTIDKSYSKERAKNKKLKLLFGLVFWQVYIYVVSLTGFIENFDFPPRFAILLILPVFVFTGIFIYQNRNQDWIQNISPQSLIYYQSFRILIESLFVLSIAKGILHENVTIEGYNYDMIFGASAPLIAIFSFQKNVLSRKLVQVWNYFGLAIIAFIIFLFMSTIYAPNIYGYTETPMPIGFTQYPYILVAAFLMPSAVFIHVLSIVQFNNKRKHN